MTEGQRKEVGKIKGNNKLDHMKSFCGLKFVQICSKFYLQILSLFWKSVQFERRLLNQFPTP